MDLESMWSMYVNDEAAAERVIDARVQRRLAKDRAYLHAEDAEEQARQEDRIENEETLAYLVELAARRT